MKQSSELNQCSFVAKAALGFSAGLPEASAESKRANRDWATDRGKTSMRGRLINACASAHQPRASPLSPSEAPCRCFRFTDPQPAVAVGAERSARASAQTTDLATNQSCCREGVTWPALALLHAQHSMKAGNGLAYFGVPKLSHHPR